MARYQVNCEGCGFKEVFDDAEPPPDEPAEEWDAEHAAIEARDTHQLNKGHSVELDHRE